jgi:hypothetical protein
MTAGVLLGALILTLIVSSAMMQGITFTNAGLAHTLSTELVGGTPITTWYLGLINNSPTPTLLAGDTLASHTGWTEIAYSTGYMGNRPAWGNGAVSGNATTNASTVNFAMLGTYTVYGMFVCSAATGTSGTLEMEAPFSGGTQSVSSGDSLQTTMTASAVSG